MQPFNSAEQLDSVRDSINRIKGEVDGKRQEIVFRMGFCVGKNWAQLLLAAKWEQNISVLTQNTIPRGSRNEMRLSESTSEVAQSTHL